MQIAILFILTFFLQVSLSAQSSGSPFIRLDQFGYRPESRKVAVIADPVVGFDAAQSFTPGNVYEVRRAGDAQSVFSGTPVAWKSGVTHAQSGDKGWWFDFSSVTTPGEYYLYDVARNVSSHRFMVSENVYGEVLKHAVRTYYYQRLNFPKQPPYTDAKWTDGAAYEGPHQDKAARSRWAKNDPATARDVHGGWMDAGDVNKYTTFAESAVIQLLEAYRRNPAAFTDDFNIPESGNGIPDILDELMWELDFLKRMQDATGTNGFLLKVGVDNYNDISPPGADTRPRYYLPECTSATLAGCAMFAQAGVTFNGTGISSLQAYGADLIARAGAAWQRAGATTSGFTQFQTDCDDGDIKSGDADRSGQEQLESAFTAAVYLYEATGNAVYRSFVETRYTQVRPFSETWWGPYRVHVMYALLRYSQLDGVNQTVANAIRNQKANMNYAFSIDTYNAQTDLYRAFMDDWAHHWGSNLVRANCGTLNMDYIVYDINPGLAESYREVAEQYLHWLHGANPLNLCMLSNMYAFGGDACVNEIYHTWFGHGTIYDNVFTSPNGPAPGYLTGGPNKDYSNHQVVPPAGQPPQKSYKEFNEGWPQNSWEITEPAIYYNAAYILLLSHFAKQTTVSTGQSEYPAVSSADVFRIFPNPAADAFVVQFSDARYREIQVFDTTGVLILEKQTADQETVIDLKNLPAGMYRVGAGGVWKAVVKR